MNKVAVLLYEKKYTVASQKKKYSGNMQNWKVTSHDVIEEFMIVVWNSAGLILLFYLVSR